MPVHLEVRHLDMVLGILAKYVPEYEVWLFGSRAHGRNLKKASDIDLCVRTMERPLSTLEYGRLKSAFEDSDLPFFVDVVDWAATASNFQKIIELEYEVIQRGKAQ